MTMWNPFKRKPTEPPEPPTMPEGYALLTVTRRNGDVINSLDTPNDGLISVDAYIIFGEAFDRWHSNEMRKLRKMWPNYEDYVFANACRMAWNHYDKQVVGSERRTN